MGDELKTRQLAGLWTLGHARSICMRHSVGGRCRTNLEGLAHSRAVLYDHFGHFDRFVLLAGNQLNWYFWIDCYIHYTGGNRWRHK